MVGLQIFISAWNSHTIPRKGIPNILQLQNSRTTPISPSDIPAADSAVSTYRDQRGSITDPQDFGYDPTHKEQREQEWAARCGMSTDDIYTQLMCNNTQPLQDSIFHYINITANLSD